MTIHEKALQDILTRIERFKARDFETATLLILIAKDAQDALNSEHGRKTESDSRATI